MKRSRFLPSGALASELPTQTPGSATPGYNLKRNVRIEPPRPLRPWREATPISDDERRLALHNSVSVSDETIALSAIRSARERAAYTNPGVSDPRLQSETKRENRTSATAASLA